MQFGFWFGLVWFFFLESYPPFSLGYNVWGLIQSLFIHIPWLPLGIVSLTNLKLIAAERKCFSFQTLYSRPQLRKFFWLNLANNLQYRNTLVIYPLKMHPCKGFPNSWSSIWGHTKKAEPSRERRVPENKTGERILSSIIWEPRQIFSNSSIIISNLNFYNYEWISYTPSLLRLYRLVLKSK